MTGSKKIATDTSLAHTEWLNFLWLELTEKCNLTCQHCYVSSSPNLPLHQRMTHADWLLAIRDARALGCKSLQFIGGEPMLYPRLEELISAARDEGMDFVEIYTNGSPVSEAWARKFRDYGVNVACSVYAADARVHDAVTQKAGSFGRTIAALQRLVQNDVPVRVGFIEMDANAGRFDETRRFLSGFGIENVRHDHKRGFGRAAKPIKSNNPFGDLCGQCWKGRLCVTATGDAYPCIMSRSFKMGNMIDDGLTGIIRSNALRSFRVDMKARSDTLLTEGDSCRPDDPPCPPDAGGDCRPIICRPTDPPPPPCSPSCIPGCTPIDPPFPNPF